MTVCEIGHPDPAEKNAKKGLKMAVLGLVGTNWNNLDGFCGRSRRRWSREPSGV